MYFCKYYKSIHRHYFFVSSLLTSTTVASQVFLSKKCFQKCCMFFACASLSLCQVQLRLVSTLFTQAGGDIVEKGTFIGAGGRWHSGGEGVRRRLLIRT